MSLKLELKVAEGKVTVQTLDLPAKKIVNKSDAGYGDRLIELNSTIKENKRFTE